MAASTPSRADAPKLLGVRATPEQRRVLQEAARREHRSVSSFVLQAAMTAARTTNQQQVEQGQRRTKQELDELLGPLRAAFRVSPMAGRDPVAELIAERRAEAARE